MDGQEILGSRLGSYYRDEYIQMSGRRVRDRIGGRRD
jgi:hypothetical protein